MQSYESLFIGYSLNAVLGKINNSKELIIQTTMTPLKNKKEERLKTEAIILKHIEDNNRVVLTVSYFK